MIGFKKLVFLLFSILLTHSVFASPATENTQAATSQDDAYSTVAREYHLKAAFLRYVASFVEWPAQSLPQSNNIHLCVLGLLPSFEAINSINGKVVNDKTILVSKIADLENADKTCQLVFIAKTEENKIAEITKNLDTKPIIGFGDMEQFAERGGDMNFYILNNRLAIMINPPAVARSNIKISERMLKVVTVIPPIDQTVH